MIPRQVVLLALVAAAVFYGFGGGIPDDQTPPDSSTRTDQASNERAGEPSERSRDKRSRAKSASKQRGQNASAAESSGNAGGRTYLVTRVIDGDTLELDNGERVRLVGIDTPEVGQCGYGRARDRLTALVEGRTVSLAMSDEDRDQYGRMLRYVDRGSMDAGLQLIRAGLAIARYDSRDGYGFHPRERRYIEADRVAADLTCAPQPRPVAQVQGSGCVTGYDPCLPAAPDLDCADVNGPVRVTGSDPHRLDADGDGWGCDA